MESRQTAAQVAKWMLKELKRRGKLHDDTLVFEIAEKFGQQFTCENENDNPAIRKGVLAAFANLSKDSLRSTATQAQMHHSEGCRKLKSPERRFPTLSGA
jgi:hypothetical protein